MFVGTWLRGVLGAGGTVLVVPLGLVLAVVLAATLGGSSTQGLRQLLAGPQVPGVATAGGVPLAVSERDVPAIPVRPRRTARAAVGGVRAVAAGTSGARRGTPAPERGRPREPGADADPPPAAPARTPPAAGSAPAPVALAPTPAPTAGGGVRELTRTAQAVVTPVLPPVGTVDADAVGTVVDLLVPRTS
jgi:hypothetical protein